MPQFSPKKARIDTSREEMYIFIFVVACLSVSCGHKTVQNLRSFPRMSSHLAKEVLRIPGPEKTPLSHFLHIGNAARTSRHADLVPWRTARAHSTYLAERTLAARCAAARVRVAQGVVPAEVRTLGRLHAYAIFAGSAEENTCPSAIRRSTAA